MKGYRVLGVRLWKMLLNISMVCCLVFLAAASASSAGAETGTKPSKTPGQAIFRVEYIPEVLLSAGFTRQEIENLETWLAQWTAADLYYGRISPKQARARVNSTDGVKVNRGLVDVPAPPPPPHAEIPLATTTSTTSTSSCYQAWNGPNTGAWYRVDTDCSSSSWYGVSKRVTWGSVINNVNPDTGKYDGLYQSAGVFNGQDGVISPDGVKLAYAADVGFYWDRGNNVWRAYRNDERLSPRWQAGSATINPVNYPVVDVYYQTSTNKVAIYVTDVVTGYLLTTQEFELSSEISLNIDGVDIGWYRFDSIAQDESENLQTGSKLDHARTEDTTLHSTVSSPLWTGTYTAPSTYDAEGNAYSPGPCCSPGEINSKRQKPPTVTCGGG